MQAPRIRVLLGQPDQVEADVVVLAGVHAHQEGRTVTIAAPRFKLPSGPDRALAEAYREAVALANARGARSMVLPGILARGPWPLDDVTRIALTVLLSTPTTVSEVIVVASTPALLEAWAEAISREPGRGPHGHPMWP